MIAVIAQLRVTPDRDLNLMNALSLIKRAIQIRANIIVLPEVFNTGFFEDNYELVEERIEDELELILKLSERNDAVIIGGVAEREEDKLYNTAVVIHRGKILEKYRKILLFPLTEERKYFVPGNELKVVETPVGKIGLMICYEARFPEIARKLMLMGAEIIAVPAQFPSERIDHWVTLLKARAIENQVYVIGANCGGERWGDSLIVDPWGEVVARAGKQSEIIMAEIDLNRVKEVREKYPFLKDLEHLV